MAANELCCRMDDYISAMPERIDQIRRWRGVVDDQWDIMLMGNGRDFFDIERIELRVTSVQVDGAVKLY